MLTHKKGMTLNEIMVAVIILALSFIPIIGVITSAMNTTEKDDHIIKAMSLCQEKLNAALQFPFDGIPIGTYNATIFSQNTDYPLNVVLGAEDFRIQYISTLTVASETVTFRVPMFDFTQKSLFPDDSKKWATTRTQVLNNMVKRYTVTVNWEEKESLPGVGTKRFYTLSALKANVRR